MFEQLWVVDFLTFATVMLLLLAVRDAVEDFRQLSLPKDAVVILLDPLVGGRVLGVITVWLLYATGHLLLMFLFLGGIVGVPMVWRLIACESFLHASRKRFR